MLVGVVSDCVCASAVVHVSVDSPVEQAGLVGRLLPLGELACMVALLVVSALRRDCCDRGLQPLVPFRVQVPVVTDCQRCQQRQAFVDTAT